VRGLEVANQTRASGGRRTMFLTSPFIDQAISLRTPVPGIASEMGMFVRRDKPA
jgi:hypothetical protein